MGQKLNQGLESSLKNLRQKFKCKRNFEV